MKTTKKILFFIMAIVCSSCSEKSQPEAYVLNQMNIPILLYSDTDSLMVLPLNHSFLADIIIEGKQVVGFSNCKLGLDMSVKQMKIYDTTYCLPEQYISFLKNWDNYELCLQTENSTPPYKKHTMMIYEYYLTAELVDEIINAAEE